MTSLTHDDPHDGRRCSKCGTWKDRTEFYPRRDQVDGRMSICKVCSNKLRVVYNQKYLKGRPVLRTATPEGKRCPQCDTWKPRSAYYDRPRNRSGYDSWCILCRRAEGRKKGPQWRVRNAEKMRLYAKNRRARKRGARGTLAVQDWRALCAWFDRRCLACGNVVPLTADHVVPLTRGGANDITNIQPLCLSCNSQKHTKTIDYRDPDRFAAFLRSLLL